MITSYLERKWQRLVSNYFSLESADSHDNNDILDAGSLQVLITQDLELYNKFCQDRKIPVQIPEFDPYGGWLAVLIPQIKFSWYDSPSTVKYRDSEYAVHPQTNYRVLRKLNGEHMIIFRTKIPYLSINIVPYLESQPTDPLQYITRLKSSFTKDSYNILPVKRLLLENRNNKCLGENNPLLSDSTIESLEKLDICPEPDYFLLWQDTAVNSNGFTIGQRNTVKEISEYEPQDNDIVVDGHMLVWLQYCGEVILVSFL